MEEQVGELWHRLISRLAERRYPQAAVPLHELRHGLGILYRALGGDGGLRIEAADAEANRARRNWLQRLAGSDTHHWRARRDESALQLPPEIAVFGRSHLNRDLYFWLTALAACMDDHHGPADPDGLLGWNQALTVSALQRFPGLRRRYHELVAHHLAQRPDPDSLKPALRRSELMIRQALQQPGSVSESPADTQRLPAVPLWLAPGEQRRAAGSGAHDAGGDGRHSRQMRELEDLARRKAERVDEPDKDRGLVTVRMENIFTMGEFVNVDRGSEQEEDIDRAESVARDLERLSVSKDSSAASATLKFDLDLPASDNDDAIVSDGLMLPEWDWRCSCLQPDRCHIVEMVADSATPCALPSHLVRTSKRLRAQFEALAPSRRWQLRQAEGQEVDIDALIRYRSDRLAGHAPADACLYRELRSGDRDLSCLLLADLSLSTDTWIDDHHRVIDVIRDSLFLFAECLQANGDRFALHGFSSRRRDPVRLHRLKGFDEQYGAAIRGRIAAIKPGYYTRMGAAIRFAVRQLLEQGSGRRLLLVLTDGKPNDLDRYEGRYGIEDTRQAVLEARRAGLLPFCVTIDAKGNDYLPWLFGRDHYVVIRDPARLPLELPRLYARFSRTG